jgi:putative ABC transport system permease protein
VLAESILLLVLGGMLGIALAQALVPLIVAGSGGVLNLPRVGASSWALGLVLMLAIGLIVGALPATSAMRLRIVDALAGR